MKMSKKKKKKKKKNRTKQVHLNISNNELQHQNKLLAFKLRCIPFTKSCER